MLFRMLNVVYLHISTLHSLCAVTNMAVVCSSLISYFLGTLLTYSLSDSEMSPLAPIITGITLAFTFHLLLLLLLLLLLWAG